MRESERTIDREREEKKKIPREILERGRAIMREREGTCEKPERESDREGERDQKRERV